MSDLNLKPCPFCGSDNGNDIEHLNTYGMHWLECRKCGAKTESTCESKKEALEAWNKRPTEGALTAKVAEKQAEIERLLSKLVEIEEAFYGQNMGVINWHQNGDIEPMDDFFEQNDWLVK